MLLSRRLFSSIWNGEGRHGRGVVRPTSGGYRLDWDSGMPAYIFKAGDEAGGLEGLGGDSAGHGRSRY